MRGVEDKPLRQRQRKPRGAKKLAPCGVPAALVANVQDAGLGKQPDDQTLLVVRT